MRYGCITASKAYEVSVCLTPDGSLMASIMGAKIPDTAAMKKKEFGGIGTKNSRNQIKDQDCFV